MSVYEVTVQGRGIRLDVGDRIAVGFFRTFRVVARDPIDAEQKAVSVALVAWKAEGNAKRNQGDEPSFSIESVTQLPWWKRFAEARKGYAFYPEESGSNAV